MIQLPHPQGMCLPLWRLLSSTGKVRNLSEGFIIWKRYIWTNKISRRSSQMSSHLLPPLGSMSSIRELRRPRQQMSSEGASLSRMGNTAYIGTQHSATLTALTIWPRWGTSKRRNGASRTLALLKWWGGVRISGTPYRQGWTRTSRSPQFSQSKHP